MIPMGFWSNLLDVILGYDVIAVDRAIDIATSAIKKCDQDGNGMLNGREVIKTIKAAFKAFWG